MRRFGQDRLYQKSYRRRPGAYAIISGHKGLLLTYQSGPSAGFQLPGGGIDPGETPQQALHREVMEETGYRISQLRFLRCYQRFAYMPEYDLYAQKICHIYIAWAGLRHDEPTEADHMAVWVAPEQAADLLESEGDAAMLRAFTDQI